MSGIAGVFDRSRGGVDPDVIETMSESIAHRGPDGGGRWCDERVGLGHQLLATTPEASFDAQPLRDGQFVVTADARIDNRAELLSTLSISKPAHRIPDSELLLRAYRRWGKRCVERLIGSFAFAIWDANERTLFCGRDRVGVKPFYYHRTDDLLAFASEPKALLSLSSIDGVVDEAKIGEFLTGAFDDETRSYYESIARLPPAHTMTAGPSDVDVRRYWTLDPTRTITLESDRAYERRFRELLERAVRCRLRCDGPVGSDLSGGLDSSSITVVARDLLPSDAPLHTFSNVYENAPSSDEREFIDTVVEREGIDPHYVFAGTAALPDRASVRTYFDRPPHNTLHFARWEKTKRARDVGVDVMLGGDLGDSAVGYGLGLLPELFRTGRLRHLFSELRAISDLVDTPVRQLFVRQTLYPMVPEFVRYRYRRLRNRPVLEEEANPTLSPEFVDRTDLRSRYAAATATGTTLTRTDREWQWQSITAATNAANFETTDQIAAAFGIEPRYPFTDTRLLEFSLAIPPTQRLSNGMTRSILRRSLSDLLPDRVRTRPWKTMMNEAFWNALAEEEPRLRALTADPGPLERYVDVVDLEAALERFDDRPTTRDARALWRALSLATWLETTSASDHP
ncbi:asparagine synthase (glutamine-hydrolyzing) [Natrarchaeobius oligotrophus]|uniref:Putative asparagine synthetase [glutamine-hydrolyzing] n=1 Tax=Natrarchaeobius chitinivorans TaxID=1679083 RepID=A0A3N6NNT0_NATCH|nr:asparagine synthase (glutamine-hydrolyzing) [Natrarchaeobius chitinivorans]RQH01243.1 asparagine synthase (glutamine-hydrolyzing) [Natrarchaeobius chitinivorans]